MVSKLLERSAVLPDLSHTADGAKSGFVGVLAWENTEGGQTGSGWKVEEGVIEKDVCGPASEGGTGLQPVKDREGNSGRRNSVGESVELGKFPFKSRTQKCPCKN